MSAVLFSVILCLLLQVHAERPCVKHLPNGEFVKNVKCIKNDTYCGEWDVAERKFTPLGCQFREVTTDQALKCLANKTIAFIGDSQLEGLSTSLGLFLMGVNEHDRLFDTYWKDDHSAYMDYILHLTEPTTYDWGEFSVSMPSTSTKDFAGLTWQLIMYGTRKYEITKANLPRILNNNLPNLQNKDGDLQLRPADFAFVNAGLHSREYFNSTPYGENYFNSFVKMWLDVKDSVAVPSVYTPMNNECQPKIVEPWRSTNQAPAVNDANWYTHKRLREMRQPFFDLSYTLKVPQMCELLDDGVHFNRWAEIINAKILLNYLCDDDWNWVGSLKPFVETEIF